MTLQRERMIDAIPGFIGEPRLEAALGRRSLHGRQARS
ncbi:hypothetical protein AKJ09_11053 [Labilithrix luteola]|uniref:Uncharacterized protein n=1 Tax=Labilithrix luteola TaxID=1391654 RepID=A0A0K1QG30_9BACT|nr:hypothetical protein AKJ09_11053 [Labilithrix luteola]